VRLPDCVCRQRGEAFLARGVMTLRKRKVFGLASAVVLVLAAGLVSSLLILRTGRQPAAQASGFGVSLGASQQMRLERDLTAPAITTQATAVAAEIRSQFVASGRSLLPAGSHISIRPATFHATSPGTATVRATISGPQPGSWQLLLIKEGPNWLLIGTRRLP
jgi:hypothetical protein